MCYYVVLFLFYLSSHCHEYNFIPQTPLKRATEAHHQQSFGAFLFCDRITNYLCTINVLNLLITLLHVLFGGSLLVLYLTTPSWKRIHLSNIIWRAKLFFFIRLFIITVNQIVIAIIVDNCIFTDFNFNIFSLFYCYILFI